MSLRRCSFHRCRRGKACFGMLLRPVPGAKRRQSIPRRRDAGKAAHCSLFWKANKDSTYFDVSLGVLDDTSDLTLDAHIFVDMCPHYMTVPNTAPHMTEADVLANPLDKA